MLGGGVGRKADKCRSEKAPRERRVVVADLRTFGLLDVIGGLLVVWEVVLGALRFEQCLRGKVIVVWIFGW